MGSAAPRLLTLHSEESTDRSHSRVHRPQPLARPAAARHDPCCRYCLTVLVEWPHQHSWRTVGWPKNWSAAGLISRPSRLAAAYNQVRAMRKKASRSWSLQAAFAQAKHSAPSSPTLLCRSHDASPLRLHLMRSPWAWFHARRSTTLSHRRVERWTGRWSFFCKNVLPKVRQVADRV